MIKNYRQFVRILHEPSFLKRKEEILSRNNNKLKISFIIITVFLIISLIIEIIGVDVLDSNDLSALGNYIGLIIFIIPVIWIMYYCINTESKKANQEKLKALCINTLLKGLGDLKWSKTPKEEIPFIKSKLFSTKHVNIDDCIFGQYKGVDINAQEVEILSNNYLVISLTLNKNNYSRTIIRPKCSNFVFNDKFVHDKKRVFFITLFIVLLIILGVYVKRSLNLPEIFGWICAICTAGLFYAYCWLNRDKKYEKIVLEDLNFDNQFSVFSENQVEARYLITPIFMEKFKHLQRIYNSPNIECSFFEDKIIFALPVSQDLFEPVSISSNTNEEEVFVEDFCEQILAIYDIIDYFKLDVKTGL